MTDLLSKERLRKLKGWTWCDTDTAPMTDAERDSLIEELLQRREAAERPVAEIRCMEDMSLCVENVSDGFGLGRHKVFAEPPLTSAERERLAKLEAKVVHYESTERARKSFDQTADIIKRADEAERKAEELESRLAAYDRAAKAPVATVDIQSGRPDGQKFALVYSSAMHALPDDVYYLFTAPPLPVVPDEIDVNDPALDTHRKWMADGWNRCRATMLQSVEHKS
ncbi:substrate-binding domain-containing protein [Pectobacterium cacticida]|uniref:hypothetical protein n=1 Tax=Pectobacterium cacticida TaxID=69221 RepID=UPI003987AA8A